MGKNKEQIIEIGAMNQIAKSNNLAQKAGFKKLAIFDESGNHSNLVIRVLPGSFFIPEKDLQIKRLALYESSVVQIKEGIELKMAQLHHRQTKSEVDSTIEGDYKTKRTTYKKDKKIAIDEIKTNQAETDEVEISGEIEDTFKTGTFDNTGE